MKKIISIVICLLYACSLSAHIEYLIKENDTFESIASKYSISVAEIKKANPYLKGCIPGSYIKIPIDDNALKSKTSSDSKDSKTSSAKTTAYSENYHKDAETTDIPSKTDNSDYYFEGELLYRSDEVSSKALRIMSFGMAYNGTRTTMLTVSSLGMRISDLDMHIHTVIVPGSALSCIYSDITKKGHYLTLEQINQMLGSLDLGYTPKDMPSKNGEFTKDPNIFEYAGDLCYALKGSVYSGDSSETDAEFWIESSIKVPEHYKYFLNGVDVGGIAKKFIIANHMDLPIIGHTKAVVATELVGVNETEVDLEDLIPTSDISLTTIKDIGKLVGFYKENNKQLKKLKLNPKSKSVKEVELSINQKWDFADEWLKKEIDSETSSKLEKELSESLSNAMSDISNLFSKPKETISNDESNSSLQNISAESDKEMLYIPDAIAAIEHNLAPLKRKLNESEQNREFNQAYARKKTVRVGSNLMEITVPVSFRPTISRMEESSIRSTIEYFNKIIKTITNYGFLNKTDYIPKGRYDNIFKVAYTSRKSHSDLLRKQREQRHRENAEKYYRNYVEKFVNEQYSDHERDFDWIDRCKNHMKNLREKWNLDRSKWEDWNGFTDPTK